MSTPFLSEIRILSFNFPPKGWAFCNGQVLPIAQNTALFSLLGTTYGGNGTTNFNLPDLRTRSPKHVGTGFILGQPGGTAGHTLSSTEMPAHSHVPQASNDATSQRTPVGNVWANSDQLPYASGAATVTLQTNSIGLLPGSTPHNNEQPYLVLNFSIALQGIYPSRS